MADFENHGATVFSGPDMLLLQAVGTDVVIAPVHQASYGPGLLWESKVLHRCFQQFYPHIMLVPSHPDRIATHLVVSMFRHRQ
jgi:hypothetical protein